MEQSPERPRRRPAPGKRPERRRHARFQDISVLERRGAPRRHARRDARLGTCAPSREHPPRRRGAGSGGLAGALGRDRAAAVERRQGDDGRLRPDGPDRRIRGRCGGRPEPADGRPCPGRRAVARAGRDPGAHPPQRRLPALGHRQPAAFRDEAGLCSGRGALARQLHLPLRPHRARRGGAGRRRAGRRPLDHRTQGRDADRARASAEPGTRPARPARPAAPAGGPA
ncbi:hypothetical protein M2437_002460 [Methylorubrum pseudosasae]|nr:hypothetical protein [Methylorubrum pseudosasae]